MKRTAQIVGGLFLCFGALWIVFAVAMRTKFRPVQNAVRRMNRAVFNPRAMETAGQPGAYASVIQHLGRTSGASYETPVQALASGNGFMIPLPYGSSADWLQNVRASGSAVIVHEGNTHRVDRPEIVPRAVAFPHVPFRHQWSLRVYGVDNLLQVRLVEPQEAEEQTTGPA